MISLRIFTNTMSSFVQLSQGDVVRMNQGRKREIHPEQWKDNVAKSNRNAGQPYKGRNGVFHPGLLPPQGKPCGTRCTKGGCEVSDAVKGRIFEEFRALDYNSQSLLLAQGMNMTNPTSQAPGSAKEVTIEYSLVVEGMRRRVCRETFLSVFQISRRRLETVSGKMKANDITLQDRRGKGQKRKKSDEVRQRVRDHIGSFPHVASHYTRREGQNTKRYLEPGLTLEKMYDLFIQKCREEDEEEVEMWLYRDVFFKDFKLSMSLPKQDTCDRCDLLTAKVENEQDPALKLQLTEERDGHVAKSTEAYENHKRDVEDSHMNAAHVVVTADMQQIQFLPNLKNSAAFFLRKFSHYNFGIHDEGSGEASLYLWTEDVAKRGSVEIASSLWKYFTEKYCVLPDGDTRTLTLWTDRCCGQNNNRFVLLCLIFLVRRKYFTKFVHKFFFTGHSYNDCDRDFGSIEVCSRRRTLLTPSDIEEVIREARNEKPFSVLRLNQPDFLDFKALHRAARFPTSLKVTGYHQFEYDLAMPDGILAYEDYGQGVPRHFKISLINARTNRRDRRTDFRHFDNFVLPPAYNGTLRIPPEKLDDIKKLRRYLTGEAGEFFDDLFARQEALGVGAVLESEEED